MPSLWTSLLSDTEHVGWSVVKLHRILSCHSPRHLSRYFTVRELVHCSILCLQPSRQSRLLITLARFESPRFIGGAIGADQLVGYRYCIRTPDYVDLSPDGTASPSLTNPATTISTAPIGGQGPASPTQTGQPVDCIRWYTAQCMFIVPLRSSSFDLLSELTRGPISSGRLLRLH